MPKTILTSLFLLALLLWQNAQAEEAPPAELRFRTPAGFVELPAESELFRESSRYAVKNGRLLRMYLPRHIAGQTDMGRQDAVTQQVLVSRLPENAQPTDRKGAELLARSMEGFFNGFTTLPRLSSSASTEEKARREAMLDAAMQKGSPILAESLRTPSAYLHTCIIHFPMDSSIPASFLSLALGLAAVPVHDTVLFITANSIIDAEGPERHLLWAKETVANFADTIDSANRLEKK